MKIENISIKEFRQFKNLDLKFGRKITAIAGQNGTGKSTILGLIGHLFSFREKDNSIIHRTLEGKPFETEFAEIFRFSYPKHDKSGKHIYVANLDNEDSFEVASSDRIEKGKRKELRLNVGKKAKGEGKRTLPVIYLGLKRLFPLAQEERINQDPENTLTADYAKEYQELHNEILILDEIIKTEYVDVKNKKFYAVTTEDYDSLGNSAGQDNLGQILTALFSFNNLKKTLKGDYLGGILLIDELDATLYPGAQRKLIEKLFKISGDLNLQIIFTTHSLDILEILKDPKYKFDSEVIFLIKERNTVKNVSEEAEINEIINHLKVFVPPIEPSEKICVFCEDEEARLWLKNLLGTKITKNLQILTEKFGGDELVHLAKKKIPIFKESIFVLDGDKNKQLEKSKCPRIILLPGKDSPEKVFYNHLRSLDFKEEFGSSWGGYNKQVCFCDCPRINKDRIIMKKWFNDQKRYFGRGYNKLFNNWKNINKDCANEFKQNFEKIMEKIK